MTNKKLRIGTLASVLSVSMLLACGGGGDDTPTSSTAVAAGSSTDRAPATAALPFSADRADPGALSCGLNQPAGIETELLARVNQLRSEGATCGATQYGPATLLTWNKELLNAAAGHSADMAQNNYFSHISRDGRTPPQRLVAANYDYASMGENIAAGQPTVEAAVNAWLTSPDHCKNMMNPVFREVAVACIANPGSTFGRYWSMELGRKF